MHQLRPYQYQCIQASLDALDRGVTRQVASLPVGTSLSLKDSEFIMDRKWKNSDIRTFNSKNTTTYSECNQNIGTRSS